MKTITFALFLALALPAPIAAQDHLETVRQIRRELTARGVIPAGIVNPAGPHGENTNPCGVFQITLRVAWVLRDEGWGLLEKASGNHCAWQGGRYSMDFVLLPDGRSVDIAVGGEFDGVTTDAAPAWSIEPIDSHIGRWKQPIDPEDTPPPSPTPAPTPEPPVVTPAPVPVPTDTAQLDRIEATVDAIQQDTQAIRSGLGRAWKAIGKYATGPIVTGILTYLGTRNKD